MPKNLPLEAMIHLMVVTSAVDRDMTDIELARIGEVVHAWPVFVDFDPERLLPVAQECQSMLHEPEGLDGILVSARAAIPERLRDTAYAAAYEVAAVDLELRMEEVRVLDRLREALGLDDNVAYAIERSAKARHRMLT